MVIPAFIQLCCFSFCCIWLSGTLSIRLYESHFQKLPLVLLSPTLSHASANLLRINSSRSIPVVFCTDSVKPIQILSVVVQAAVHNITAESHSLPIAAVVEEDKVRSVGNIGRDLSFFISLQCFLLYFTQSVLFL